VDQERKGERGLSDDSGIKFYNLQIKFIINRLAL
jgi:hypothetical protein